MVYTKDITISRAESEMINALIKDGGMPEKEAAIKRTAGFKNGMEMDIMCCGADEYPAWTQAVLFDKNGAGVSYTEPAEEFLGRWELTDDAGNSYVVNVKEEGGDNG